MRFIPFHWAWECVWKKVPNSWFMDVSVQTNSGDVQKLLYISISNKKAFNQIFEIKNIPPLIWCLTFLMPTNYGQCQHYFWRNFLHKRNIIFAAQDGTTRKLLVGGAKETETLKTWFGLELANQNTQKWTRRKCIPWLVLYICLG